MHRTWKEWFDVALGFCLLVGMVVGSVWLVGVTEAIFGPERSGLFGYRH